MHAFQVGEHDLPIERVSVLSSRMLDYRLSHDILVFAGEVSAAARAGLFVHR